MQVFHGTSFLLWGESHKGRQVLHLTSKRDIAIAYAYDAAASDEENELSPILAMVYEVDTSELDGLEFLPDRATAFSYGIKDATWEQTEQASGAFRVEGDIENFKSKFKLSWQHS